MANFKGFFDSMQSGGTHDRVYGSEDFASFFELFLTNGIINSKNIPVPTAVLWSNKTRQIGVSGFGAMINGYGYNVSDETELVVDPPSADGSTRIDSVVLKLDKSINKRSFELYIKKGTHIRPDLTRNVNVFEIALFDVYTSLKDGVTDIKIETTVKDKTRCGITSSQLDLLEDFVKGHGYRLYIQPDEPLDSLEGDVWIKVNENFIEKK